VVQLFEYQYLTMNTDSVGLYTCNLFCE